MDVEKFLTKNLKWITLVVIVLFLFKSVQSCTRDTKYNRYVKKSDKIIDSLNVKIDVLNDSLKDQSYQLQIAKERVQAETKRANSVESTAAKVRANTTIKIENKSQEDKK
jgi:predicted phage tail protein